MEINQNVFQLFDQAPSYDNFYTEVWCGQLKFAIDLNILINYSGLVKAISDQIGSLPKNKQSQAFSNNFNEKFQEIEEKLKISKVNIQFFLCLLIGKRLTIYSNDLFDYFKLSNYFQIQKLSDFIQNLCESLNNVNDIISVLANRKITDEEEENFNEFIECGHMKEKLSNEIRHCFQLKNFRNNLPLSSIFRIFQCCKDIHLKAKPNEVNYEEMAENLKSENEKLKQKIESIQQQNDKLIKSLRDENLKLKKILESKSLKPEEKKLVFDSNSVSSRASSQTGKSFLNNSKRTPIQNKPIYKKNQSNFKSGVKSKITKNETKANKSENDTKSDTSNKEIEKIESDKQKSDDEASKKEADNDLTIEDFEDESSKEKSKSDTDLSKENFEDESKSEIESNKSKSDDESEKKKSDSESSKSSSDDESSKEKSDNSKSDDESSKENFEDESSKAKSDDESSKIKSDDESSKKNSDNDWLDENFEDEPTKEKSDDDDDKDKKSENESNQESIEFLDDFE